MADRIVVRHRRWALRDVIVVGVVATCSVLATSAAAGAEVAHDAVTGVAVRTDGGPVEQAVAIQGIHPGSQHETAFFLDGTATPTIRTIALAATNIRDFENSCNRPERNTPDDSCGTGEGQGELSEFLQLSLAAGVERDVSGSRSCDVAGPATGGGALQDATELVVVRPSVAAEDDVMCLAVTLRHAMKGPSDNLTQTDSVLFDLELRFEGEDPADVGHVVDETDVGGVSTDPGTPRSLVPPTVAPGGDTLTLGLAATGAPVLVLLGLALGLVGAGVLARTLTRRDLA